MTAATPSPAPLDRSRTAVGSYAPAFFGLLATRISERIVEEGARIAKARGIAIPPRCMSTMITLRDGPMGVSEISRALGVSHVAVIKNVRRLHDLGFTRAGSDPDDARRKPIELTSKGKDAAVDLDQFIAAIQQVYREVFDETGIDAYDAMARFEDALNRRSFFDRLDSAFRPTDADAGAA